MRIKPMLKGRENAFEGERSHRSSHTKHRKGDKLQVRLETEGTLTVNRTGADRHSSNRVAPTVAAMTGSRSSGAAMPAIVSSTNSVAANGVF